MESGKKKIRFCEPAHRLDMATASIVLASSKAADRGVKTPFREREPKKHYQAFVGFGGTIMASRFANDL